MNPFGLILVAVGLFTTTAGVADWDWFMNHPKAHFVCRICTRTGARIFYGVLGLAFIVFGVLVTLGIARDSH